MSLPDGLTREQLIEIIDELTIAVEHYEKIDISWDAHMRDQTIARRHARRAYDIAVGEAS